MSYRLFLNILLIITIIATACICVMKPQMHKSVLVYNSEYTLTPRQEVITEQTTLPAMPAQPEQKVVREQSQNIPSTQTVNTEPQIIHIFRNSNPEPKIEVQNNVKTNQVRYKTATQTQTSPPKTASNRTNYNIDVRQIAQRTAQNIPSTQTLTQNSNTNKVITSNPSTRIQYNPPQTKTAVKTVSPSVNTTGTAPVQKVLTAQEEEILWNRWRSNLQNKIMSDVKLPAIPTGTVFRFTFNVDKYGKITNVQTWSDTPKYTPYAIQFIAPVIRSYQGRSILNFPTGSKRTSTNVKGGWRISPNAKFSTPQDYNDTERIVK